MKVSNNNCRRYVKQMIPFKGSNLYAEMNKCIYTVYSYGRHFPLFVCKDGVWYENNEKYSVTTSKHRSQSHPHFTTVMKNTQELLDLIS